MAATPDDVLKLGKQNGAQFVDIRFSDLPGLMQHFSMPFEELTEESFEEGFGFDGSSIRGFQEIQESDMILVPDPDTAVMDPFRQHPTLIINAFVKDPLTERVLHARPALHREEGRGLPQGHRHRRHRVLRSGGRVLHLRLDPLRPEPALAYHYIDAVEGVWNSGAEEEGGNLGYKPRYKEGYFPVPPMDHYQDLRSEMVVTLRELGHPGRGSSPRGRHRRPGRDRHGLRFAARRWPTV